MTDITSVTVGSAVMTLNKISSLKVTPFQSLSLHDKRLCVELGPFKPPETFKFSFTNKTGKNTTVNFGTLRRSDGKSETDYGSVSSVPVESSSVGFMTVDTCRLQASSCRL